MANTIFDLVALRLGIAPLHGVYCVQAKRVGSRGRCLAEGDAMGSNDLP